MQEQQAGSGVNDGGINAQSNTKAGQSNGSSESNYGTPYDQARAKTGEVIDQVEEKVGDVVGQVREQAATQLSSQLSSQKDRVAEGLGSVAQMLHFSSDQLRQNNQAMFAEYSDKAAQGVDNASKFLRERDLNQIVGEVENFARREPLFFLGGAFTLGLLATRFLKSSASSQSTSNNNNTSGNTVQGSAAALQQTANRYAGPTIPAVRYNEQGPGSYQTSQPMGSSVARHFGETNAVGPAESPDASLQNPAARMQDMA